MAGNALRKRKNWQTKSGPRGLAGSAEKNLITALRSNLDPSIYEVNDHPKDLKHLYEHVVLPDKTLSEIFTPSEDAMKNAKRRGWGVFPDFSIRNKNPARFSLVKSNAKMVGLKVKHQVLDGAMCTKECVSCLLPVL